MVGTHLSSCKSLNRIESDGEGKESEASVEYEAEAAL